MGISGIEMSSTVPRVLLNNYLMHVSNDTRNSLSSIDNCANMLPVSIPLHDKTANLYRCASNMHLVLWSPEEAATSSTLCRVRLFSSAALSSTLSPEEGCPPRIVGVQSYPSSPPLNFSSATTSFLSSSKSSNIPSPSQYKNLKTGEYLMIPSGYLAEVDPRPSVSESLVPGESETPSALANPPDSSSSQLLASCLVDASNIVSVEDSLRFTSRAVSFTKTPQPHSVSFDFASPLGLKDPHLVMERSPLDLTLNSYANHLLGIRPDLTVLRDSAPEISVLEAANQEKEPPRKGSRDRRRKGTGSASSSAKGGSQSTSADFKTWQDLIAWKGRMVTLTLPRPLPPLLLSQPTRTSVDIELTLSYWPAENDKTSFGVLIKVCRVGEGDLSADNLSYQQKRNALRRSLFVDLDGEQEQEVWEPDLVEEVVPVQEGGGESSEREADRCNVQRVVVDSASALSTSPYSKSSATSPREGAARFLRVTLSPLVPFSIYQASARLFVARTQGPISLFTPPFITPPLAPPTAPGHLLFQPDLHHFPLADVPGSLVSQGEWFSGVRASVRSTTWGATGGGGATLACAIDFSMPSGDTSS